MTYLREQFPYHDFGTLYCDLDGVLVDFMGGAEKVLGRPFKKYGEHATATPDERLQGDIIGQNSSFWYELEPMKDCYELWNYIERYTPHVLTATPAWDDPYVIEGKKYWVQEYLNLPLERLHIVERNEKKNFAITETFRGKYRNILIDDYEGTILEFQKAGGIGCLHLNTHISLMLLKSFNL